MSRRAELFIDTPAAPPFHFGPGIINSYLRRGLADLGYDVESHTIERLAYPSGQIPLETVQLSAEQERASRWALRVFCTRPLDLAAPRGSWPGQNMVFFHGFGFNPTAYLQSSHLDMYCANSAYVMRVLASLLLYPTRLAPTRFLSNGPALIGHVSPPVPLLDYPEGYPSVGSDFSPSWVKGHGRGCVLGHALRPGKALPDTTLRLLDAMNTIGERLVPRRTFKIFVSETDLGRFQAVAPELPLRRGLDQLLVPLPHVKNSALVTLMRQCAFSLCFDDGPEAFGLYPLESVAIGVPVYGNGSGNVRFLLPRGHGLRLFDNERLYVGSEAIRSRTHDRVACAIAQSIVSGSGARACAKGLHYIEKHYDYPSFLESLRTLLAGLDAPRRVPRLDPGVLRIQLGPLVRRWNRKTGYVISDYVSTQLPPGHNALLTKVLDRRPSYIPGLSLRHSEETILDLFRLGILSLSTSLGSPMRLAGGQT